MTNPYDPNANAYGGGSSPFGGSDPLAAEPQPVRTPSDSLPPFVDPYQPADRQPPYPPAIYRRDLAMSGGSTSLGSMAGRAPLGAAGGGLHDPSVVVDTPGAKIGAVSCLLLVAFLTLSGGSVFALGVAALFSATTKSHFVRSWARSAFNLLVTYFALAIVSYVVLGLFDFASNSALRDTVGNGLRTIFAVVFFVSAGLAGTQRFLKLPGQIRILK